MNEENVKTLKIEECKFRYNESELGDGMSYYIYIGGDNPSCDENNYKGVREREAVNKDYYISKLTELLENPTIENSLRIWKTMSEAHSSILFAHYIPNKDFQKEKPYLLKFHSRIVHLLINYAWIPDQEENFYKPDDPKISSETIHKDFKWESSKEWFYEVGLIQTKRDYEKQLQKQQEFEEKEKAAKILGFTMEEIEIFTKYKKVIENRIGKFVDIFETQNN